MNLGKAIQDIRDRNNMTQEELGKMLHVTRQTISNCENEKSYPDLITLIEISDMFDISLDTMLKGDRDMTEKLNKEINWGKRLKIILPVAVAAILLGVAMFFWLYWGIVPVKSSEVEITHKASYTEHYEVDGIDQGPEFCIDFYWKLNNGKCIEVRNSKANDAASPDKQIVVPYATYKIPFDDRGDFPGEYEQEISQDTPFTDEDVLVIEFKDKTVEYHLKEIAEEAGIQ